MATARRHFDEDEYDDYGANANGAAFCRSAALIVCPLQLATYSVNIHMALSACLKMLSSFSNLAIPYIRHI